MNKTTLSLSISILALVACLANWLVGYLQPKKVGFVRSQDVFEKYVAMKEANDSFKKKVTAWQANLDTLDLALQKGEERYELDKHSLSAKEKQEREAVLEKQVRQLEEYRKVVEEKAKEEDKSLLQGVVNQVNSYVKEYGKAKGYAIIMGTTSGGNILYGDEAVDLTEQVVIGLNQQYKGK